MLAYSARRRADRQPLGGSWSIPSDDFDSVYELYLEDDFWQLSVGWGKFIQRGVPLWPRIGFVGEREIASRARNR